MGLIWYTQRVFLKAIFNTLMIKQAAKQKLLPLGYSNSSILEKNYRKRFNTLGFIKEKPQKSTRIAVQYSIVHRRVSEFLSILIFI